MVVRRGGRPFFTEGEEAGAEGPPPPPLFPPPPLACSRGEPSWLGPPLWMAVIWVVRPRLLLLL